MAGFAEYDAYDGLGLAQLVARGDVAPAEVLEAAIARALALNPTLNAINRPLYEEARGALVRGLPPGPFRGVPFLLKDLHVALPGVPTSNGGALWRDRPLAEESTVVERYRRAGLVIMGKTATPELGLTVTTEPRAFGPTRNPWALDRSAGGSSGGAAAAVAAGIVPAAHASDGGGSIRIPAAACGLVGLKPTRGRVPLGPGMAEGWCGMTVQHVVSRSVRDSAALLDATAAPVLGDPSMAPAPDRPYLAALEEPLRPLRIGFAATAPAGTPVASEVQIAVDLAARLCEALGHHVEPLVPVVDADAMGKAAAAIMGVATHQALETEARRRDRPVTPDEVERVTWQTAENGRRTSGLDHLRAIQTMHRVGGDFARSLGACDVFLWPVLAEPPLPLGELHMMPEDMGRYVRRLLAYTPFCMIANMAGLPALSLPLHWTPDGLPIGVQFIGRFGAEATLLRLAAALEDAKPWARRRPPLTALGSAAPQ